MENNFKWHGLYVVEAIVPRESLERNQVNFSVPYTCVVILVPVIFRLLRLAGVSPGLALSDL